MNPYHAIGSFVVGNLSKSLIQNLFWKTNSPVRGSIVYCDLAFGYAEHSGVYVGNGRTSIVMAKVLLKPYQFISS